MQSNRHKNKENGNIFFALQAKSIYLATMRREGTKYPIVNNYDKKMMPVSQYAGMKGISVAQVYIQYDRHVVGYKSGYKGPYPGYTIRQFNGMNFVIPD